MGEKRKKKTKCNYSRSRVLEVFVQRLAAEKGRRYLCKPADLRADVLAGCDWGWGWSPQSYILFPSKYYILFPFLDQLGSLKHSTAHFESVVYFSRAVLLLLPASPNLKNVCDVTQPCYGRFLLASKLGTWQVWSLVWPLCHWINSFPTRDKNESGELQLYQLLKKHIFPHSAHLLQASTAGEGVAEAGSTPRSKPNQHLDWSGSWNCFQLAKRRASSLRTSVGCGLSRKRRGLRITFIQCSQCLLM